MTDSVEIIRYPDVLRPVLQRLQHPWPAVGTDVLDGGGERNAGLDHLAHGFGLGRTGGGLAQAVQGRRGNVQAVSNRLKRCASDGVGGTNRGLNAGRSTLSFSFAAKSDRFPTQRSGGQGSALSGAMAVSMALAAAMCSGLVTSKRSRVATIKTPPPATVWLSMLWGGRIRGAKRGET